MYIRGRAASLHPGSGLSCGKVPFFATLAGAQKENIPRVTEASVDSPRRTRALLVRLSPDERRSIRERAHDCGMGASTYMRETALGSKPRARPRRLEQKAVYHLGRIGNNLNQLAYIANATGRLDDTSRLHEVLNELLTTMRRLV